MSEVGSVTTWIEKLRDGDPEAAFALWQRYYAKLVQLAQKKLGRRPRRMADEEDVVSEAFAAFACGVAKGRFPRLADRKSLWPLLIKITEYKAKDQIRYELRKRRGGKAVRGHSGMASPDLHTRGDPFDAVADMGPSPDFVAELTDHLERLLSYLDDEQRQIAIMKMEGHTIPSIAKAIGRSTATVERRMRVIRNKWEEVAG